MTILPVQAHDTEGVFTERPGAEFIDDFLAHVRDTSTLRRGVGTLTRRPIRRPNLSC